MSMVSLEVLRVFCRMPSRWGEHLAMDARMLFVSKVVLVEGACLRTLFAEKVATFVIPSLGTL